MFGVVQGCPREPFRLDRIFGSLENSLRGCVKSDGKEFGDRAPKSLQISDRPIVERAMILEVQGSFFSQPFAKSRQVALADLLRRRPPKRLFGGGSGFHG